MTRANYDAVWNAKAGAIMKSDYREKRYKRKNREVEPVLTFEAGVFLARSTVEVIGSSKADKETAKELML